MRVLIFGGNGMLGHKLVQVFAPRFETWSTIRGPFPGLERFGFFPRERTISGIDVSDFSSVEKIINELRPDTVVNCIGVIKQRPSAADVVTTLTINSLFPQRLAHLAEKYKFKLITISTDCVFSGTKGNYSDTDVADALDLYGQSKHWGEVSSSGCLTLRTSIIGRELSNGHSLIEWFLSQRGKRVEGYSKAIYSGFPTITFAGIIVEIIENHPSLSGVYNVSSDPISKFDLLTKLKDRLKFDIEITDSTRLIIDRSLNSGRFRQQTGFAPKSWDEMIESLAADCRQYE